MARGITFGSKHSNTDLSLILQSTEIVPAVPKTNYVEIPGADGSVDLTEALGVGVKYADAMINATFALYPGDSWYTRQSAVSSAINGLACNIKLDEDPDWYYEGRVTVSGYKSDKLLRQITVSAQVRPYKRAVTETTVTKDITDDDYTSITCANTKLPVSPSITVTEETTILFNGNSFTLSAGTHNSVDGIVFTEGNNVIQAKTTSAATGSITIKYRKGALV